MCEPGMEAVLADLVAEHVRPDEATTGKGDPLAIMVPCEICQGPHQYGERCGYCDDPTWLTGANWPPPCLRCGSREHKDCYTDGLRSDMERAKVAMEAAQPNWWATHD